MINATVFEEGSSLKPVQKYFCFFKEGGDMFGNNSSLCKQIIPETIMISTICLLILIYSILKRPVGWLVNKLEDVDWISLTKEAWGKIVLYSKKLGRSTTRKVLQFYYVMSEGNLSSFEKASVYAGIIYIVVPNDLLPRKVLGWIGILDDVGVASWIYNKVGSKITPDIELKVEKILDEWFGYEIQYVE